VSIIEVRNAVEKRDEKLVSRAGLLHNLGQEMM
jgi:hypothetical protein